MATWRNVAMGRGQFPNRVKSNQPYGRGLLTLNGTVPLPTAPDLCSVDTAHMGRQRGTFHTGTRSHSKVAQVFTFETQRSHCNAPVLPRRDHETSVCKRCAGPQPAQRYLDVQRSAISTSNAAQFIQQSPHKIQTKFQLYLQMISFNSPYFFVIN